MLESVRVVPVFVQCRRRYIFLVRQSPALSFPEWTSVGGAIKFGADQSMLETALREWSEEVPAFPWAAALRTTKVHHHIRWKWNSRGWVNRGNWIHWRPCAGSTRSSRGRWEGVNATAWLFLEAQPKFFAATAGKPVALVPESCDVVRPGGDRARCHTEGALFVEHEVGAWFEVVPSTGGLKAPFEGASVRGDLGFAVLGDKKGRQSIWEFLQNLVSSDCGVPAGCNHDVAVTPTGLRDKLEVFEASMAGFSAEQATDRLVRVLTSALDRGAHQQFYYEEVQCCLSKNADARRATGHGSLLRCVLVNGRVNESIALRSAELLCGALRSRGAAPSAEEQALMRQRADRAPWAKLRDRWRALLVRS